RKIHTLSKTIINHSSRRLWERHQWLLTMPEFPVAKIPHPQRVTGLSVEMIRMSMYLYGYVIT
ncbi:hypothetical protein ACNKFI_07935, partial [Escherichia coli]